VGRSATCSRESTGSGCSCRSERDRYQNGAYWATANGWVIYALGQVDKGLATRTINDLIADFRTGGICECVGPNYRQLPDYVCSGTNALGGIRRVKKRRGLGAPGFGEEAVTPERSVISRQG
jgi:hypothetical protein